jgi:putative chitinase
MKFDHIAVCQSTEVLRVPGTKAGTLQDLKICDLPRMENLRFKLGKFEQDPAFPKLAWIAYALATCLRETGTSLKPIAEWGGRDYCIRMYGHRKDLGNLVPEHGWIYRGRGDVQATGLDNYSKLSKVLGVDLVKSPDRLLEPELSYRAMSYGMTTGLFTGRKLADYAQADGSFDWRNARRIINGLDHADEIAFNARVFEKTLRAAQI